MSKILGIDYGARRIGLALWDEDEKIILPWRTLEGLSFKEAVNEFRAICKEYDIQRIVLGLPRSMNGNETLQTRETRQFGEQLSRTLALPVSYVDERLTTKMGERLLGKTKRKNNVDQLAAALILETYLHQARGT